MPSDKAPHWEHFSVPVGIGSKSLLYCFQTVLIGQKWLRRRHMPSGKAPHWGHFCDPSPHWGHLGTPPPPPPYCPLPFLARYMVQSFYIPYGPIALVFR